MSLLLCLTLKGNSQLVRPFWAAFFLAASTASATISTCLLYTSILYHHRQLKSCISSKPPQYPYYTIKNNEITTRVHEERTHNISFFSIPVQFPLNAFFLRSSYAYLTACLLYTSPTYIGEESLYDLLSDFSCPENPDVVYFLLHNAIEFTKKDQSITYLAVSYTHLIAKISPTAFHYYYCLLLFTTCEGDFPDSVNFLRRIHLGRPP